MAERVYNLYEAKTSLSALVERAAEGEVIFIAKAGEVKAKLVRATPRRARRPPGGWKGKVRIGKDFDAPLPPELQEAFEGSARGRR
ncbi:MAG TPA: type II toxin-antitoxin system prevent-host-death family antitoxin [Polyangia bacterium]|jgi:antitoxin (DNA-binding transcriptional repressor) of toxin-antitoxin stability system